MDFAPPQRQMTIDAMPRYKEEIDRLKKKYAGKISIYRGMELEFFSDVPTEGFDYIIGSVHYLKLDGKILGFDRKADETDAYIRDNFGGDGMKFAKAYFETLSNLPTKDSIDIVGHFDLVAKNNEPLRFVDEDSKEYLDLGFSAIDALKGKIPLFEVNTGCIPRGYRSIPYPKFEFLEEFYKKGFGAIISSDCHNKDYLDSHFEQAADLLKAAGFKSRWIYTDDGFKEVEL